MKKIIFSALGIIVVIGIIGGTVMLKNVDSDSKSVNQEEIKEKDDKQVLEKNKDTEESKSDQKQEKTEQSSEKDKTTISSASKSDNSTKNNSQSKSSETKKSESNTESKNNQSNNNSSPIVDDSKNQSSVENNKQQNNVSTVFFESITHGEKEFSSEEAANIRGTKIQNNELDYVLDYNEQHPDSPIQPDINYFRVYPSVIDENGKTWYYLHFFCQSGEGNDKKLKSMY